MFSSLSWGQSQFDEAVEKATSEMRLAEEDIALNLEICDQIRSKAVSSKDAARALRRRLAHRNPNIQLLALTLTDVCVKNGGDHFLVEIAGKEFMDNMTSLLQAPNVNIDVRSRILHLIQNWAVAFEGKPVLSYVNQVYKDLSSRGFSFPPKDPVIANSAMIDTSTAPEWIDSDVCLRCRTSFSFTNRKHHCRNCGQVFDQQCSSRSMALPHFGITQEVRVCDSCHTKLTARRERKERSQSADFHTGHRHRHRRHSRDVVDADLQRAIQLSLADTNGTGSSTYRPRPAWHSSEPPLVDRSSRPNNDVAINDDEDDPELRAAIEASLREARAPRPSAPEAEPDPIHNAPLPVLPNNDLLPREEDAILTFSQTVQDEPGAARRNLARVHALYNQASGLRPKLALSLDDAGKKEQMLGEMHEKLSHAVKLYDQLLTEQLARPVWQRNNAPSRAGTWHAGSYGASSLGYNRAEQRPQGEVVQHPPQPYQQHQHKTLQRQHIQSDQSRQLETQQQPSQVHHHQQQDFPQAYQQLEPLQPYQQQQYQPEPPQTYQAQQHQQQQESSHSFQSRSYEIQQQPYQQQQQQQQQQPEPAQPYDKRAQPYSEETPTLAASSSYPNKGWGFRSASYQHQPPTPAQSLLTPTLTHELHQPPQLISPSLIPQYTAPMTVQSLQYIGSAQSPVQSRLAASQFQPGPSPTPPPPPQSTYEPIHSPQSVASAFHSVHASPPAQTAYQPMQSPHYTQARQMPMFPTAPTSNPQAFPLYGPGPPSGLEQSKKEVALIDL